MKVLNLYAGIGGNRKLWENVEVTAIERDPQIAMIYQDLYPQDTVIVTNAHKFLINNYEKYDFIWSSPPCPSHSRMRNLKNNCDECEKKYPNMMLYEEIIFLTHFFKGMFCIENVISYYDPLITPFESENHYFWSNFIITKRPSINRQIRQMNMSEKWGFDLTNYNINKRLKHKMLNNMVHPNLGLHVFNCAFKIKQKTLI